MYLVDISVDNKSGCDVERVFFCRVNRVYDCMKKVKTKRKNSWLKAGSNFVDFFLFSFCFG